MKMLVINEVKYQESLVHRKIAEKTPKNRRKIAESRPGMLAGKVFEFRPPPAKWAAVKSARDVGWKSV